LVRRDANQLYPWLYFRPGRGWNLVGIGSWIGLGWGVHDGAFLAWGSARLRHGRLNGTQKLIQ
jgi:hypothetical protein